MKKNQKLHFSILIMSYLTDEFNSYKLIYWHKSLPSFQCWKLLYTLFGFISKPLATNDTDAGRQINRGIELRFVND